jgi:hypothetical protein
VHAICSEVTQNTTTTTAATTTTQIKEELVQLHDVTNVFVCVRILWKKKNHFLLFFFSVFLSF